MWPVSCKAKSEMSSRRFNPFDNFLLKFLLNKRKHVGFDKNMFNMD